MFLDLDNPIGPTGIIVYFGNCVCPIYFLGVVCCPVFYLTFTKGSGVVDSLSLFLPSPRVGFEVDFAYSLPVLEVLLKPQQKRLRFYCWYNIVFFLLGSG